MGSVKYLRDEHLLHLWLPDGSQVALDEPADPDIGRLEWYALKEIRARTLYHKVGYVLRTLNQLLSDDITDEYAAARLLLIRQCLRNHRSSHKVAHDS